METIKAKSKLEALKTLNYDYIYWKGNKPYCQKYGIYTYNIFASKVGKNEYIIISERVK